MARLKIPYESLDPLTIGASGDETKVNREELELEVNDARLFAIINYDLQPIGLDCYFRRYYEVPVTIAAWNRVVLHEGSDVRALTGDEALSGQVGDLQIGLLERLQLRQLAADMHIDAHNTQPRQPGDFGVRVQGLQPIQNGREAPANGGGVDGGEAHTAAPDDGHRFARRNARRAPSSREGGSGSMVALPDE